MSTGLFDTRSIPLEGKVITEDRFYYREDRQQIRQTLESTAPVFAWWGLRRFGKTSFLRRIERFVNGVNAHPSMTPESYDTDKADPSGKDKRAYFVECLQPDAAIKQLEFALSDTSTTFSQKVVLLDDLQGIADLYTPEQDSPNRFKMEKSLGKLFAAVRDAKDRSIRIIISEPTNHGDWLAMTPSRLLATLRGGGKGDAPQEARDDAATMLKELSHGLLLPRHLAPNGESSLDEMWLPRLNPAEARNLLANSHDQHSEFQINDETALPISAQLGGNPWLLVFAYKRIRANRGVTLPLLRAIEEEQFVTDVHNDVATANDGPSGLLSIYNSLSNRERLALHIVSSKERGAPEVEDLYPPTLRGAMDIWKDRDTLYALNHMGLTARDEVNRLPVRLLMRGLDSFMESSVGEPRDWSTRGICANMQAIDNQLWRELVSRPHPREARRPTTVIHQFADLFFFDMKRKDAVHPWDQYLARLEALAAADSDQRPHFIVICGNLLAGGLLASHKSEAPQGRAPAEDVSKYRDNLSGAFERILTAVKFLRPTEGAAPSPRQILIIPGLLDLRWVNDKEDPIKVWKELIAKYGFGFSKIGDKDIANSLEAFPEQNVCFAPFDTLGATSTTTSFEAETPFNRKIMTSIRRRIRAQHIDEIIEADNDAVFQAGAKAGKAKPKSGAASSFFGSTLRYIVSDAKTDRFDPDNAKMAMVDYASWTQAGARLLSDIGAVSLTQRSATLQALSKVCADNPNLVPLAVTHHCPVQRRRAALVEFFQAHGFRRALVKNNVHWVLHGHAPRMQLVVQREQLGPAEPREALEGHAAAEITLSGSGPFCDLSWMLDANVRGDDQEDDDFPKNVGFVEISVMPVPTGPRRERVAARLLSISDWTGKQ
jgi:hypothetical protein